MHKDTVCDGCKLEESSTKHTLEYKALLGRNKTDICQYMMTYLEWMKKNIKILPGYSW